MQLIKQTILHFQDAKSDKVYEVDLCQVGTDRYVVNFRYGRRGSKLQEGTKTPTAVALAQAEKTFEKLVKEKTGKGYQDITATAATSAAPRQPDLEVPTVNDQRQQAVLHRLAGGGNAKWPLERAVWRAGELQIKEATPLLISRLGIGEPLLDYCLVWALGKCGDASAIEPLRDRAFSANTPEFIRRIAWEALVQVSEPQTKTALRQAQIELLPSNFKALAQNGTPENFTTELKNYLNTCDYQGFSILDRIYQIDNENTRPALLEILRTAPLKPNYFKPIRHILKIAEYRQDAEILGLITYRIETTKAMYEKPKYYWSFNVPEVGRFNQYESYQNQETRRWESVQVNQLEKELLKPDSRIAYNSATRAYLQRRIWRTLRTVAELDEENYVKMAIAILLQFSDQDAIPIKETKYFRYDSNWRRIEHHRHWDAYCSYLVFNHILYENSPRYSYQNGKGWSCQNNYKPGDPVPATREEAFPKIWEKHPESLLQLLLASKCEPVHNFAVKALRSCSQFSSQIAGETLIKILQQPYAVTAKFAVELLVNKYDPSHPDLQLVLAVVNCADAEARAIGYRWIDENRQNFINDSNFLAALITSSQSDTRQFAQRLLSSSIISNDIAKVLIGRIIVYLLALTTAQNDIAQTVSESLLIGFTPQLRDLGMGVIFDLVKHPLVEIQTLGARILLNHNTQAIELPPDLITSLMESPYQQVRGVGIRIFGNLPDEVLISAKKDLILAMTVHPLADIRNAIQPIIKKLAPNNPNFSLDLATELINILLIPERHEGVHSYLLRLLRQDLPGWMPGVSKEITLGLLKNKSESAQELAGLILEANPSKWAEEFETVEIVKLANNELLLVREGARSMFSASLAKYRQNHQEMLAAVRLLESKWDDSREFAQQIFSQEFSLADWTPEVLVTICDSIKDEVRQFGRNLVTQSFQSEYGTDYLLKFSEHPSTDMQLFVTNYLASYAQDDIAKLTELTPYFITVLSQINRGRVAKQRVLQFLENEAQKNVEAASIVAEILTRQSLTIVKQDKAATIQTMLKIKQKYPQISLPIQVKEAMVKG